jgi:flagella basal body P-ring formation protein FlgA
VPAAEALPPAAVAAALALARDAALAIAPAGARIEVAAGTLDPRLRLAPCERVEPYRPAGAAPWGRTRVALRCRDAGSGWNVVLPLTVKVFAPALVGTQALAAGTVIDDSQLQLAEVDWSAAPTPPHTQAESLRGRTLARPVAAGAPPRAADLRARQWFAAGDTVKIVASGRGFEVSGEGQALGQGIDGQTVRVKTDGGRVVSGIASGARRVEVTL